MKIKFRFFNSAYEAVKKEKIDASIIFVPAQFAADAVIEAICAKIPLIITITEGIPAHDVLKIKKHLNSTGASRLIGPNCPGIIVPDECKIGIMPVGIHKKGTVGVVSRSGTLTYEAVKQLTDSGIGQSACVGIGGDQIIGTDFVEILKMFENDEETKLVVLIGEIGGNAEMKAAEFIKEKMKKPVIAFIAGITAPPEKRMGHAGAIIGNQNETAQAKMEILEKAGATVVKKLTDIGKTAAELLNKLK